MNTNSPHISASRPSTTSTSKLRLALVATVATVLLAAAATALIAPGDARPAGNVQAASGYAWPLKPFDRPHPVRANFGDPRTTFDGPPTAAGLESGGIFAFHFGIDIAAPDRTPVYAVASGVAQVFGGANVRVDHGSGFVTEYWHVVPAVRSGQQVKAYATILGRVLKGHEHVHFSEQRHGTWVNPLVPGHLRPYVDRTKPEVASVSFRDRGGAELLPEFLHGKVDIVVSAFDTPARRVSGIWADLPVAPAAVSWRLDRVDGRRSLAERVALDFRRTIPKNSRFWSVYARGTRQNASTFNGQRAWRVPGVYLYRLARLDTRRLPGGIYRLVVTARDTAGNAGSATQTLIVRNTAV